MPNISKLNPQTTALLMLDLQNDVIMEGGAFADSGAPAHATSQNVVENVKRLAAAVRSAGGQVIIVNHFGSTGAGDDSDSKQNAPLFRGVREANALVPGTWGAEQVAGLEAQPGDIVVQKQRHGAFSGTPLEIKLRGLGAESVIVTGAWTNMSVEMTTRQGADLGFSMVLVTDGTSTVSEEWQNAAVNYAVQNLAETGTTDEVIAAIG